MPASLETTPRDGAEPFLSALRPARLRRWLSRFNQSLRDGALVDRRDAQAHRDAEILFAALRGRFF